MVEKTIAVFGSAFNPPHYGHVDVIHQAAEWADAIIVVPSYRHAFDKIMSPFEQRVNLAKALVDSIAWRKNVIVSDIERNIAADKADGKPVYTYDLLLALSKSYPNTDIVFVVGPDNASPNIWNKFYRADDIVARWGIWAAEERVHVRSTAIRQQLQQGHVPTEQQCPAAVIELLKHTP